MKERGILFSDAMVRAILAGKKTQTRRAMRTNHVGYHSFARWDGAVGRRAMMRCLNDPGIATGSRELRSVFCENNPYGVPGDRLWVRECWKRADAGHGPCVSYRSTPDRHLGVMRDDLLDGWQNDATWRPSLLMPRWASRITLEVTGVRVERAQAISDADVAAEGVDAEAVEALLKAALKKRRAETWPVVSDALHDDWIGGMRPADRWRAAWCLINGRESWESNPFVWVIEFKVVPR